ncbi:MAG: CDP-alcohol phosphatidyltransferase family protein [Holosporaceae bacterium]
MRRDSLVFLLVNLLTLLRLCSVPCLVWLLLATPPLWGVAFLLFSAAAFTDFLDGFLARRFKVCSAFGAALDPLADKALGLALFYVLWRKGCVTQALFVAMCARDAVIVGGVLLLKSLGRKILWQPLMVSKIYTALQLCFLFVVLLYASIFNAWPFESFVWMRLFLTFLWAGVMLSAMGYIKMGYQLWTASLRGV